MSLAKPNKEGREQAKKGQYHNPYSLATQRAWYLDFEEGWKDEMSKRNPSEVVTKFEWSKWLLAVLVVGIISLALYFYK